MLLFTTLIHLTISHRHRPPPSLPRNQCLCGLESPSCASTTDRILTRAEFAQVQEAWAVRHVDFALLLQRYKADCAKTRTKLPLKLWSMKPSMLNRWPASEHRLVVQMQRMSRKCKVTINIIMRYYL